MTTLFSVLGYAILLFLVISNLIGLELSAPIVIVFAVISAVLMCISILVKDKNRRASK